MLYLIFFTQEQTSYFDHKNMLFIFFSVVFAVYLITFMVALFFEYPFRTLVKVVISPPKKIIRLKKDLAKQLRTMDTPVDDDDRSLSYEQ